MAKIVSLVVSKWATHCKLSASHTELYTNPDCQFDRMFLASPQVSLVFQGNRAIFAPVMYISSLDACSWFNNSGRYFTINITETMSFMRAEWVTLPSPSFPSFSSSLGHLFLLHFFSLPFSFPSQLFLPYNLPFFTQAKLHFRKWVNRSLKW